MWYNGYVVRDAVVSVMDDTLAPDALGKITNKFSDAKNSLNNQH